MNFISVSRQHQGQQYFETHLRGSLLTFLGTRFDVHPMQERAGKGNAVSNVFRYTMKRLASGAVGQVTLKLNVRIELKKLR